MNRLIKLLSIVTAMIIAVTAIPFNASAAAKKVRIAGNSISVAAKQICLVCGSSDDVISQYLAQTYAPEFKKYYYVDFDTAVNFKDIAEKLPELQKLVVVTCDIKNPKYVSKMENLVQLGLYGCSGTDDLSFLKNATGLKKLWYANSKCTDISAVGNLKNLNELSIRPYKYMDDISAVGNLTKLVKLDIAGKFSDISAIGKLKKLKELCIECGAVTDLEPLGNLKKLQKLSLEGMLNASGEVLPKLNVTELKLERIGWKLLKYVKDMPTVEKLELYNNEKLGYVYIKTVGDMTWLKSLTIDDASLSKCDFVAELTKLESLTLSNNKIQDFSPLKKLTNLKTLDLKGNDGGNYSAVLKLTGLEQLNLLYSNADESFVKKFKKANPDCEVYI